MVKNNIAMVMADVFDLTRWWGQRYSRGKNIVAIWLIRYLQNYFFLFFFLKTFNSFSATFCLRGRLLGLAADVDCSTLGLNLDETVLSSNSPLEVDLGLDETDDYQYYLIFSWPVTIRTCDIITRLIF